MLVTSTYKGYFRTVYCYDYLVLPYLNFTYPGPKLLNESPSKQQLKTFLLQPRLYVPPFEQTLHVLTRHNLTSFQSLKKSFLFTMQVSALVVLFLLTVIDGQLPS
jgi:hypothetical protein